LAADPENASGVLAGAVIAFDLDGTLIDTAPDLVGTLNVLLAEEGLPVLPLPEVRTMIGRGAMAMLERGFTAAGETLTPERRPILFERFIDLYTARIADESRPYPGLIQTLDDLAAAGAILAVCTNKRTSLSVALLDALGLSARFAAIVGPDAAPAAKPDPRHLTTAIAAAGGRPGHALMVGDSQTDFDAARAAGVPVALVTFGYTEIPVADLRPDALIDHYSELPAAARRLLSAGAQAISAAPGGS
jgi:phosphoglycolate phosphatase